MNQQDDRVPEPEGDSLDDLFLEAQLAQAAKNPKQRRVAEPSLRQSLDAATKKMKDLYALPENWEAARGIALIDKDTQTLIGNFREYVHKEVKRTRKLVREHTPISIDATEVVNGYLGADVEWRIKDQSWERELEVQCDVWLDELMLGCPAVELIVKIRLGALVRVEVKHDTQFASVSGATLLQLPAGTNIMEQMSIDSKTHLRRQVNG